MRQPQEQVLQSQVFPQLQVFFEFDILFLLFFKYARDAHSITLTLDYRKHYTPHVH